MCLFIRNHQLPLPPGICLNGDCENLFMSYRCLCRPGYKHADSEQKVCVDVDECENGNLVCRDGICRNNEGGFTCICPRGMTYNDRARACLDINECAVGGGGGGGGIGGGGNGLLLGGGDGEGPCVNGICVNSKGSFRCECRAAGTVLDATGRICVDIRRGTCWTKINNGR